jgi:hypothetical protein
MKMKNKKMAQGARKLTDVVNLITVKPGLRDLSREDLNMVT